MLATLRNYQIASVNDRHETAPLICISSRSSFAAEYVTAICGQSWPHTITWIAGGDA